MLYKFKPCHNATEAIKNICCTKGEGTVDHSTVIGWFKKFCLGCKNVNNQARSSRPKSMNFKAMTQAIEANLVRSPQRVSGELSIAQSNMVGHLHGLGKSIGSWLVLHIIKILQNFWLTLVIELLVFSIRLTVSAVEIDSVIKRLTIEKKYNDSFTINTKSCYHQV